MPVSLVTPSLDLLPDYVAALERGWSPDNLRKAAAEEELARIAADPAAFLALIENPEGIGPPVLLPNGRSNPRLPGVRRWIWDEGFCGSVGFRWYAGGSELPPWFTFGHVGYGVPEWKRGRGYATAGLAMLLPQARARGLTWVELTTDAANIASQRVVAKNGGYVVSEEDGGDAHGGRTILRWRIALEHL